MAKTKDIIIKRKDGLYAIRRHNGILGWSNKANATHFTGKSKAKREFSILDVCDVVFIDLNNRSNRKHK